MADEKERTPSPVGSIVTASRKRAGSFADFGVDSGIIAFVGIPEISIWYENDSSLKKADTVSAGPATIFGESSTYCFPGEFFEIGKTGERLSRCESHQSSQAAA